MRLRFEDLAADSFAKDIRKAENRTLIAQLVSQLQTSCQTLISSYLLEQQALAEYAEKHGIKLGTVYSQWHRCVEELKKILDDRARKGPGPT